MNINLFWENQHQPQHLEHNEQLEKQHDQLTHHQQPKNQYHQPQPFKCEYCDLTCCSQEQLDHHQLLHSRRKPYACDECDARFPYNSILLWHKKTHDGQLPFKCDECGSQFQQSSMLVWHKRKHRTINNDGSQANHLSQSNIIVENSNANHLFYQQEQNNIPTFHGISTVPAMFSVPNILSGPVLPATNSSINTVPIIPHRVIDTSTNIPSIVIENPSCSNLSTNLLNLPKPEIKTKSDVEEFIFRCDICSATFKHGEYLKSHIHTKHNTGQNNPYYQVNTNQSANWRTSAIKRKLYSDRQYKCDLCGAGFKAEGHLKNHRLKHTSERPYKCKQCGLSYTEQFLLDLHERRHQTERPHKCGRCGAAFFRESQLQKHMRRHDGGFT